MGSSVNYAYDEFEYDFEYKVFFSSCVTVLSLLTEVETKKASVGECADTKHGCAFWAKSGYCESRPDFMHVKCKKSCRVCSKFMLKIIYFLTRYRKLRAK